MQGVWLRRLLTLGMLGLGVIGLIEVTYRVYLFGGAGLSIDRVNSFHEIGLSGLIQASQYPEVIYELKPNLDTWFKLVRFRTNSAGLPDREYSLSKPENTYRIVLLGSSFSMPSGVAIEESWQEVLERKLNAHTQGKRYEVINFSVGGYDTRQQLATWKQRANAYRPDLALVELTAGSPTRMRVEEAYHAPFHPRARTYPFVHSFALERLFPPPVQPVPDWVLPADQLPAAYERVLSGFKAFAEQSGVPFCFTILQHDFAQAAATVKLREQAGKHTSCIIDTTPAFVSENFSDLIVFNSDPHPNPKAQAIFAGAVFDYFVSRHMLEITP